jgi:hypothetical protein
MNRRDAISRVAIIMGGTVIGAEYFLSGCKSPAAKVNDLFNQDQVNLLNEVGDTILPATSTPGAKAANVGGFMALMVKDCYSPEDQKIFTDGLTKLDDTCKKKYGKIFMECSMQERTSFLTDLDKEQKEYTKTQKKDTPNHYFRMIKELTLLGYFTSEIGCTKALRYVPIPGHYNGDIPYKKGDRAWATS